MGLDTVELVMAVEKRFSVDISNEVAAQLGAGGDRRVTQPDGFFDQGAGGMVFAEKMAGFGRRRRGRCHSRRR